MKIAKAKFRDQEVNCCLEPGFFGPAMCSDKVLKHIGGKITRRISSEDKDSRFFREMTTHPIGWTVIQLTFTSSAKCSRFSKQDISITIPTQVLIVKHHPEFPNYIMLGFDWFTGRKYDDDELQTYRAEIVTDAEDGWVRITLRIKNLTKRKGKSIIVPVYKFDRSKASLLRNNQSGSSDSRLQQNKSKKNKVKYSIIKSESDTNSDTSDSSTSSFSLGSEDTHIYKSV
ncbi:5409_t:CDS:1 [Acaulospora morrowiae]|uniref:5409_t:CDS:1 n=1 Tax=Acaulospora morrowiae TaxID=94023 RepID=A0A9N9CMS6_9GLOM|nr:5409_t:CDS:1 [Acaulospora morrowiae]